MNKIKEILAIALSFVIGLVSFKLIEGLNHYTLNTIMTVYIAFWSYDLLKSKIDSPKYSNKKSTKKPANDKKINPSP